MFNQLEDDELDPITGMPKDPTLDLQRVIASPTVSPELKAAATKKLGVSDYSPDARQAIVDQNSGFDTGGVFGGALASLGAAFQGKDSMSAANNVLNQRRTLKNDRLAQFDQGRIAAEDSEKNDPTSRKSKVIQDTVRKLYPNTLSDEQIANLTAADSDLILKPLELKQKMDQVKATQQMAHEDRMARNEYTKGVLNDRATAKANEADNKDAQNLDKHLSLGWSGRSGQAGVVQGKINAAEAAEALLEQAKTQPGGLDSRQIEELSQSTARLLGGGGAQASGRVEALVPHTFWGKAQSLKEYLTNHPTGSGLQAFTERMADTIKREKELAQNQKRQFQVEGLAAFSRLKKNNPDLYNSILSSKGIDPSMINEKGQYQAPAETKVINGKTYKKVQGGWEEAPDMKMGQN